MLVNDEGADLEVRAWRFSYNARGIIEMPNRLRADKTAVIMVHPWGIDDGQGWKTPEPAGVADFCTLGEEQAGRPAHARGDRSAARSACASKVACTLVSLPGKEDPIRQKLYRSVRGKPTAAEREQGATRAAGEAHQLRLPRPAAGETLTLSADQPVIDYFRQFSGLGRQARTTTRASGTCPFPLRRTSRSHADDVVIYDAEGYDVAQRVPQAARRAARAPDRLRDRHVLLPHDGRLRKPVADFNVFLVGDATLATFPANATPEVRHQCPHFVRVAQPAHHAGVVDPNGSESAAHRRAESVKGSAFEVVQAPRR